MSETVITVEKLSKSYIIGHQREKGDGLRHALESAFRAPLTWLGSSLCTNGVTREEFWALRDVSFEIKRGEVVGIIGRNGAGKSTLLKILSRITEPTAGRIHLKGRVASLLEVGTGFHPELTGRENIFLNGAILGMSRAEIKQKFDEIVAFAAVEKFLDTPVKRYSSGMYVRLAFAVAAHLEPEILIVDEVLAVGDMAFQKKCLGKMEAVARIGRTVLFVSHNMAVIKSLCARTILLSEGQVNSVGQTDEVLDQYYRQHLNHSEVDFVDRIDRTGSGNVRVVNFEARACNTGGPTLRAGFSSEFIVGYSAKSGQPVSRLYVGITVTDSQGIPLFSVSTAMKGSDFRKALPNGRVACRIDKLPLIPGHYGVDLSLKDSDGQADFIKSAASFDVSDGGDTGFIQLPSRSWGSLIVPHNWTMVNSSEDVDLEGLLSLGR